MTLEQELELIEQAKHSRQAFVELYRAYVERVYRYCFLRLPSKDVAEDVTSIVFMKLVETIADFDTSHGHRLSAWLFRVAHNQIVDFYKMRKPDRIEWIAESELSQSDETEEYLHQHTRRQQVASVMTKLNKRYQQIISLKFFAELETEEIALHLGIQAKHVYVLLHRALNAFEKEFEKNFEKSEIFI